MRLLAFLLSLFVFSCAPVFTKPLGGRAVVVAIDLSCNAQQRAWVAEELQLFGWYTASIGEVTVVCGDVSGPSQGEYFPGANEVVVDPVEAQGEFALKAVVGHELIHWRIYHGPHPELVYYHVCTWAYNEPVPPNCFPGAAAQNALMSPTSPATWDGEAETFSPSRIPAIEPTEADALFINAALTP